MKKKLFIMGFCSVYLYLIYRVLWPGEWINLMISLSVAAVLTFARD